jgi:hypothetical protein
LSTFAGVGEVTYDCSTATVRMTNGATLDRDAVAAALGAQNFKLKSFTSSPPPTEHASVFRVSGMSPRDREAVEGLVRGSLPAGAAVTIDSLGLGVIIADQAVARETIAGALANTELTVRDCDTREWPRTCARYEVELAGVDAAAWPAASETLSAVDKVLAAQIFVEQRRAVLWLKEPCSQIERRVREAMAHQGREVVAFALREPSGAR